MTEPSENGQGKRREKPQYHYFYGSTEEETQNTRTAASPAATNDQDSLVGESLLPTDNEEDAPTSKSRDLPHVVLMKGNEIQPLLGSKKNGKNGSHHRNTSSASWLSALQDHHPIAYISFLVGCLSVALIIVSMILFPLRSQNDSTEAANEGSVIHRNFQMPFPTVDRRSIGDPISSFIRKDLFDDQLIAKGSGREFVFPFPTGAFWTNLVMPSSDDRDLSFPAVVYPYAYKWSDDMLQVSYPAMHRKEEPNAIHDYFFPDLTFKTEQGTDRRRVTAFDPLSVTLRYNSNVGGGLAFWESYLVQGSPYVTILYNNVSPVIEAFTKFQDFFCPRDEDGLIQLDTLGRRRRKLGFGICSSDTDGTTTTLRGIQFVVQTAEDTYWFIFASEPITLTHDRRSKTTLFSEGKFKGVLRFAFLPPSSPTSTQSNHSNVELAVSSSKALQRLIYHAGVYPVGGSVSWTFRPAATSDTIHTLRSKAISATTSSSTSHSTSTKATRIGTVRFEYRTNSFTAKSSATPEKALLMLALPHHAQTLPASSQLTYEGFNLVYRCIKGPMTPVLGSVWAYDEVLPSLGFENDSGSNDHKPLKDPNILGAIIDNLKMDIKLSLPTLTENVYGFGKQTARLAQLAHIARQMGDKSNSTTRFKQVEVEATKTLGNVLSHFLTNKVSDTLIYDSRLGGLITSDGLLDKGADFGNGRYNDHHFHYGYLLYACAVMGNLNSTFVEKFANEVDSLFFDIAYDGNMDSRSNSKIFFPSARHKMWFDGHSFASGLFPQANGKSQESSSEAVNAYYGAYLWSLVRNKLGTSPESDTSAETDFTRLLLATEIRGARTYWQMMPPTSLANQTKSSVPSGNLAIYSPSFSKNYMVGNVGMLDVICSTWFGTDPVYVHLINLIPVTSATGELFSRAYVTKQYANVLAQRMNVDKAWRGFVVADLAIVDPNKAWGEALGLSSATLDSGLSKSQLLYWIATRSGFSAKNVTKYEPEEPKDYDESSSGSSSTTSSSGASGSGSCASHPDCSNAGLEGNCCPTPEGVMLGCCT